MIPIRMGVFPGEVTEKTLQSQAPPVEIQQV